jgi:hypothetical protein
LSPVPGTGGNTAIAGPVDALLALPVRDAGPLGVSTANPRNPDHLFLSPLIRHDPARAARGLLRARVDDHQISQVPRCLSPTI